LQAARELLLDLKKLGLLVDETGRNLGTVFKDVDTSIRTSCSYVFVDLRRTQCRSPSVAANFSAPPQRPVP
jgi:hypothetical protein